MFTHTIDLAKSLTKGYFLVIENSKPAFRRPNKGELYILSYSFTTHQSTIAISNDLEVNNYYIISKWEWPQWLNSRYLAKNSDGDWFAFSEKPTMLKNSNRIFWTNGGNMLFINDYWFNANLPNDISPEHSLFKNPNLSD